MSNQFGWLWDGEGREEAVGKGRVLSVPSALDRRQCYSSSFRPGWSERSTGQHPHLFNPRQLPWENKESDLADGGGLGNAVLSP